ncbi:MAG TPA: holo-ACP synthase [Clostridia bacterium]|nr:holo-ACP synthase [Clostridia bacterium]
MIFGIGTDIIEIKRIKKAIARSPKFIERLFTEQEMEYYRKKEMKAQHIAGGFSAKEAVLKALGTGLRGFRWKDIEILRGPVGKPIVRFGGNVRQFMEDNGIGMIHVTISHSKDFATATAVAEVSTEREGIAIEDLLFQPDEEARRNIH